MMLRRTARVAVLLAVACAESTAPIARNVATIVVSPDSVSLHVGAHLLMTAVLLDSAGDTLAPRAVTWSSTDTGVAVVTPSGVVTARTYGPVTIRATVESISGTAGLRVLVPVARIEIPPFGATLVPGGHVHFTARLIGVEGSTLSDRDLAWQSADQNVVSVSATGVVTAAGVGQTSISATSEGVTSTAATIAVVLFSPVSLASGESARHTCAVTAAGAAFCWGDNIAGALGNGTAGDSGIASGSNYPVGVVGLGAATNLAAGDGFTCAVTTPSGVPFCWGAGDHNKLGNGTLLDQWVPVPVAGNLFAGSVVVEHKRGCLLGTDSLAYCWGDTRATPVAVPGGLRFASLAGGEGGPLFCGIGVDSLGYCGFSAYQTPMPVTGGLRFIALTVGFQHVCGVAVDSLAYCWGQNSSGQLGDSTTTFRTAPVQVAGSARFVGLAAGRTHTCGLATDATARCWGANDVGQLGNNGPSGSLVPIPVTGGMQYAQIVSGSDHACGLTTTGVSYCWGSNALGQLGDGTRLDRNAPVRVQGQP